MQNAVSASSSVVAPIKLVSDTSGALQADDAPVSAAISMPVALVTGASMGLGKAIAAALCESGYLVFAASRHVGPWLQDGQPIRHVVPLTMDVTDDASVDTALAAIMRRAGRLDVLVNNAGFGVAGPFEETPLEAGRAQMETNFFGAARVCQRVLPLMRARGAGCVINISSIGGQLGLPYQSYYSASKFAMEGWSEALHYELAPHNIRVALVEPGNFSTAFDKNRKLYGAGENSPYKAACARVMAVAAADELHGGDPRAVADVVCQLVQNRKPPLRRAVGPWVETLGVWVSRILPRGWFDVMYRRVMGVAQCVMSHCATASK